MRIHPVAVLTLALSLGAGAATIPAARPAAMAAVPTTAPIRVRKAKPKLHQATGELLSLSAKSLLMLHARGRAKSRIVFYLTPMTKQEGKFSKGERIVVYYRVVNGRREIERMRRAPVHKYHHKSSTKKSQ